MVSPYSCQESNPGHPASRLLTILSYQGYKSVIMEKNSYLFTDLFETIKVATQLTDKGVKTCKNSCIQMALDMYYLELKFDFLSHSSSLIFNKTVRLEETFLFFTFNLRFPGDKFH